ncbi:hypothetical protein HK099_001606 [Clydaea vesicula]|uniref:HMG box domain-containing protein n=1 Tax=Clydaea vesicula TaxID=447962 RepID=A0AAD5U6Q9_9FUNG|nr:hypothetical protein HK099_001606 [Clydaea vesicula]
MENSPDSNHIFSNKDDVKSPQAKKPKVKKDPNAPKRPVTSFFQYLSVNRPKFAEKYPDLDFKELQAKLKANWDSLSDNEKEVYNQMYLKALPNYEKQMKKYNEEHGIEPTKSRKRDRSTKKKTEPMEVEERGTPDYPSASDEEDTDEDGEEELEEVQKSPPKQEKVSNFTASKKSKRNKQESTSEDEEVEPIPAKNARKSVSNEKPVTVKVVKEKNSDKKKDKKNDKKKK